jgi:hypothetical protein
MKHYAAAVVFPQNHFSNIISHSADETMFCVLPQRRLLLVRCEKQEFACLKNTHKKTRTSGGRQNEREKAYVHYKMIRQSNIIK